MVPELAAVEEDQGAVLDGAEAEEGALPGAVRGGEASLVPDEAVIMAQGRILGDPGRGQVGGRRAGHVIFEQGVGIGALDLRDVDILPAAVAVAGGIAVEAGDAVAIGVDRPVPGAGQVEQVAHVGGGEGVDR